MTFVEPEGSQVAGLIRLLAVSRDVIGAGGVPGGGKARSVELQYFVKSSRVERASVGGLMMGGIRRYATGLPVHHGVKGLRMLQPRQRAFPL